MVTYFPHSKTVVKVEAKSTPVTNTPSARLTLFEEWLGYGLSLEKKWSVHFKSENKFYVSFVGIGSGTTLANIRFTDWNEVLGVPMPESVNERLVKKGFQSLKKNNVFYWRVIEHGNARSLAELTEWAFREIFGEEENFPVRLDDFDDHL